VVDVGYTASVADQSVAPLVPGRVLGMTGFIGVDYEAGTLTVPVNAAIDLGGIGKGMAADIVAEELIEQGATGVAVNLGGDMVTLGVPSNDASWYVGVANPFDPTEQVMQLRLDCGGLATSGTTVRTFTGIDGTRRHHIVNPSTGRSSATELVAATVLASDAATAEIFATASMMGSAAAAVELVESVGLAGVFIRDNGDVVITSTLKDFEP
jgi:thiamine biosynthesis lipoprotein